MSRVALYGGSFDPFHICHQLIVPYILSLANVSKVIIAPCHTHAFGKHMAPYNHRLNMVSLGLWNFRHGDAVVSPIEEFIAKKNGKNFTIYTVEKLLTIYDTIVLVLGSDIAKDLYKWAYFDRLKELEESGRLEFFFVNRNGFAIDSGSKIQMPSVSSTIIREAIKAGRSIDEWVPARIVTYIKEHKLYV